MAAEASDAALLLKFSDEHLHAVDEDDGPCGHFLPPPTTATRVKSEAQRVKAEERVRFVGGAHAALERLEDVRQLLLGEGLRDGLAGRGRLEAGGGAAPWRRALEALEGLRVTLAAARAVEPEPRVVEEAALERRGAATVTKGDMLTQAKATQRAMALNLMFEELARESLGETESGEVLERAAFCPLAGFVAAAGLEPPFVRDEALGDGDDHADDAADGGDERADDAATPAALDAPSFADDDDHSVATGGPAAPRFLTDAGEASIAHVVEKVFADDDEAGLVESHEALKLVVRRVQKRLMGLWLEAARSRGDGRASVARAIEAVAEAVGRSAGEMTDCLARALAAKYELVNDAGPFAHWDRVTDEMRCDHEMVLSCVEFNHWFGWP